MPWNLLATLRKFRKFCWQADYFVSNESIVDICNAHNQINKYLLHLNGIVVLWQREWDCRLESWLKLLSQNLHLYLQEIPHITQYSRLPK
jgi:hypothetical protein